MRKLAFLVVGGAVWLLVGAMPAFADNGPHMTTAGTMTDRCAGCHRMHTAQGAKLLVTEQPALCYTCHGSGTTGAGTDVQNGVGYGNTYPTQTRGAKVGALRGGGFEYALINASAPVGLVSGSAALPTGLGVLSLASSNPTNSNHSIDNSPQKVWGNGAVNGTPDANGSATVNMTCSSCHGVHGSRTRPVYRLLSSNPSRNPSITSCSSTSLTVIGSPGCTKTVAAVPGPPTYPANTVVCTTDGTTTTCTSTAFPTCTVLSGPSSPYTVCSPGAVYIDDPNSSTKVYTTSDYWQVADANDTNYIAKASAFCSNCHTRYMATDSLDSGDATFKYRHQSDGVAQTVGKTRPTCIQCHLAHGSNATAGAVSDTVKNPDGTASTVGDSKLLRVNDRGICQMCHNR